jgi:hypothetical protein
VSDARCRRLVCPYARVCHGAGGRRTRRILSGSGVTAAAEHHRLVAWSQHCFRCGNRRGRPLPRRLASEGNGQRDRRDWYRKIKHRSPLGAKRLSALEKL